ncbi:hypothetical protein BGX23_002694 [Mortierella sp. AD031]|nr:hypothetical protein BGX23_002694 [Mortierella sp. AD031]KAG0218347.1 hypothetical protein BGX33_007672 [Mortierella sp. NVP41]
MKFTTLLASSALFMAAMVSAQAPPAYELQRVSKCKMPGVVAYTFDDGPHIYNDKLLAILKSKNVVATFFLVGQMIDKNLAQQGSLKKMMAHGHQLASHTYTHSNLDMMTEAQMRSEIQRTSDSMWTHAGVRPRYMRAPEGRCSDLCTKVMKEMGQVISYWNVDTNDWRHVGKTVEAAVAASMVELNKVIVEESNPATDSFILLQHEIHQFSVENLADVVIDAILKKGYRFVSMEECIGESAYLEISPSVTIAPPPPATSTAGPITTGAPAPVTSTTAAASATIAPTVVAPAPGGNGTGNGNGNGNGSNNGNNNGNGAAGLKSSLGLTVVAALLGLALF